MKPANGAVYRDRTGAADLARRRHTTRPRPHGASEPNRTADDSDVDAVFLPLNYAGVFSVQWSAQLDSNQRLPLCRSGALRTELCADDGGSGTDRTSGTSLSGSGFPTKRRIHVL